MCSASLPCLTLPGARPRVCADAAFTFADLKRAPWCFVDCVINSTNMHTLFNESMIPLLLLIAYVCAVIYIISTQQHGCTYAPAWRRMALKMCSSSTYYLKRTARCREGRSPVRRRSILVSKSESFEKKMFMRDIAPSWRSF